MKTENLFRSISHSNPQKNFEEKTQKQVEKQVESGKKKAFEHEAFCCE